MSVNVKNGGAWQKVKYGTFGNDVFVKVGGFWYSCVAVHVKVGGVWKQVLTP